MNKIFSNVKRTIMIGSWPFLIAVIGCLVAALANMSIMLLVNYIITEITNQAMAQQFEIQALLNIFYIFIIVLPFYLLGMFLSLYGGMHATKNYRQKIMDSSMKHHEKYVKDGHSASIMAVMTTDTYKIEDFFFQLLNYSIIHPFVHGIIAIVLLFSQSTLLAVISIVIGLLTVIISTRFSKKVQKADEEARVLMEASTKAVSELIANDDIIRMLNIKDTILNDYHEENLKYAHKTIETQVLKDRIAAFTRYVTVISRSLFLAIGIYLFTQGSLDFGIIFILIPLQASVSHFFASLSSDYNILVEVSNASERAFAIIDTPKEDERLEHDRLTYDQSSPIITFDHVNFAYPHTEPLFKDLSFEIDPHSTVAFVGESGSGKSTIFQLLLGFFEADSGSIRIGSDDIYNKTLSSLRDNLVYIEQSSPLFNKSIRENIALGSKGEASEEMIIEAAKKANIHDFILSLEDGYDTIISSSATMLSGGQRQRLAIARAFMSDALIIVMDEPTSALDNESELHIQEALERLKGEKTVLIAAHRLSTIEDADQIIVLKEGVILEQGTHHQLLDNKGYYYTLNQTQNS